MQAYCLQVVVLVCWQDAGAQAGLAVVLRVLPEAAEQGLLLKGC